MSDTPETDKAERMAFSQEYMVPTEFARRMERERDEAIEARKASAADWLNQIENANARVSAAKRERDEYQDRLRIALGERDSWRMRSEQKYAMRSELEELLGVTPADASDEQFEKGLAALKSIIRERDEARAKVKRQAERIRVLEGATNHAGGLKR